MATGNALPLDPVLEAQRRQAAQRLANFQQSDLVRRNNANMDTTNTLRQIDEEAPNVYRRLLNGYAGRGLAYSSGYGYAYGDQSNQIANSKSKAQSALAALLAGYDAEAQAQNSDYQLTLDELEAEQAAKAAADNAAVGGATSGASGSNSGATGGTTPPATTPPTGPTAPPATNFPPVGKPIDPGNIIGLPKPTTPPIGPGSFVTMPITNPVVMPNEKPVNPIVGPRPTTPLVTMPVTKPVVTAPTNTGTGGTIKVPTNLTAAQIAAQYKLTLAQLLTLNHLTSITQIKPGMTLRVS